MSAADYGYISFLIMWHTVLLTFAYHLGKTSMTRKRNKKGQYAA